LSGSFRLWRLEAQLEVTDGDYIAEVKRMAGRYLFGADESAEKTSGVFDHGIRLKYYPRVMA
jgi:hypothetical protein